MKTYPKGTTPEQWEAYEKEKKAHDEHYERLKPKREDYLLNSDYAVALDKWSFLRSVNEPNKPGYVIANND